MNHFFNVSSWVEFGTDTGTSWSAGVLGRIPQREAGAVPTAALPRSPQPDPGYVRRLRWLAAHYLHYAVHPSLAL